MDNHMITSRQNPLVRAVCALTDKKKRAESGEFRFDGVKLLGEALDARIQIRYVFVREDACERYASLVERAENAGARVVTVSSDVFSKLTEEKSPEGVLTVADMPDRLHTRSTADGIRASLENKSRILIVESLRDPGNLGTVMRSCYALGIDALVMTADCADIYNPKTVRAAMGAIFRLPTLCVEGAELSDCISALRAGGRRVFATALSDDSREIGSLKLCRGDCFVIGNEGHGLSEGVISACTAPVIIPMREGAESLNASAAAAICIWETVRASE